MIVDFGLWKRTVLTWFSQERKEFAYRRAYARICLGAGLFAIAGCGGGSAPSSGGGGGVPPGGTDFSLTATPSATTVQRGGQGAFTVSLTTISGFAGSAAITVSGMTNGVAVSPATFSLVAGASQAMTVTASSAAAVGSSTITVKATSGALTHTANVALTVQAPPPASGRGRMRYVRTDSQLQADLNFFPQPHIFYSKSTRRFFFADPSLNRVHVFNAITEEKIAEIVVPGAFQIDETPDGKTLWVGTQTGDLYTLDPVGLTVTHRYLSGQIGPSGYPSFEVHPMADGRLMLLSGQGGIPAVDGYASYAIWTPSSNALETPAMCVDGIALAALTADRGKIVMTSYSTSSGLCLYDPTTGTSLKTVVNTYYDFSYQILVPPDGKEILVSDGNEFNVFSLPDLQLTDKVPVPDYRSGVLSSDGNTLFVVNSGELDAYDWRTHTLLGWSPSLNSLPGYFSGLSPMVADETGLIAGLGGEGVGFVEGGTLLSGTAVGGSNAIVTPNVGPAAGGTQTQISVSLTGVTNVYFGANPASVGASTPTVGAVSPAGKGIVDVAMLASNGAEVFAPEAFSYGPNVIENVVPYVTAEGGGTVTLFGLGFGGTGTTVPSDLRVTAAGQVANITAYAGSGNSNLSTPYLQFAAPAGSAGSTADIVVTNKNGSSTVTSGLRYLPAVQSFSLAGASLAQGVYDPKRDLYYFSDAAAVQVFSRSQGRWLSPIAIPGTTGSSRLWGISLSPDGSKLAVADANANVIYLLDPANPVGARSFPLHPPGGFTDVFPCGVAVDDAGIVYYVTFETNGYGAGGAYRLDTATGVVTGYPSVTSADGYATEARILLSGDGARVYENINGILLAIDTATNAVFYNPLITQGDYELAIAGNQTSMTGSEYLLDTDLGLQAYVTENEREAGSSLGVYGEKLSPDGSLLFAPLTNGLDVVDARTGIWLARVGLPVTLASTYDALVSDGVSNVLVGITGSGDGVAVLDMSAIPVPNPIPYARSRATNATSVAGTGWLPYKGQSGLARSHRVAAHKTAGQLELAPRRYAPVVTERFVVTNK